MTDPMVSAIADRILAAFPGATPEILQAIVVEVTARTAAYRVQQQVAATKQAVTRAPRVQRALDVVCDRCNVTQRELLGARTVRRMATARGVACVMLRYALGMSREDVAQQLGLDSTTVRHHCKKFNANHPSHDVTQPIIDQLTAEWSQPAAAE